jgi:hypothetical protein
MTTRDKIEETVSWLNGVVAEDLEALKKALTSGQLDLPVLQVQASGPSVTSDKLLTGKKAHDAAQAEIETREGEKLARRFMRVVSKLEVEPGDLLVLHVPDRLTALQFERIASVMNVMIAKKYPDICYIVLPEVVSFGRSIKTQMSRAEIEQQLRALFGVLAEDEPVVVEEENDD